jgi:hypothetical protein
MLTGIATLNISQVGAGIADIYNSAKMSMMSEEDKKKLHN